MGSRPKIVDGSHLSPTSGAADTSSPHHSASIGRNAPRPPNVMNAVVAPFVFTFTPVGLTLICADAAGTRAHARTLSADRQHAILERIETHPTVECPESTRDCILANGIDDHCCACRLPLITEE